MVEKMRAVELEEKEKKELGGGKTDRDETKSFRSGEQ